jgi:Phytanoyl-CoA dioxygenase (PhyH)
VKQAFATAGTFPARGYAVLRDAVPQEAVDAALRRIHLDLVQRGLSAQTLGSWLWSAHWFPHLRWDPAVVGLAWHLPEELREGRMCDPQIILQPPDEAVEAAITPHVDQEPEWADGKPYRTIVGIALSRANRANGGLLVWPFDADEPEAVELEAGDAVVMHPRLPHSSGLNRTGSIRYAVYFRFLEADEPA